MPFPAFKRLYTSVFELQKLQDQVGEALDRLLAQPDIPKTLVENVDLSTTYTDVVHGLSRPITRYIICRQSQPGSVYDAQAQNPFPQKTLRLLASAPMRVSLLVF